MALASVSALIPTVGRPELARALTSVRAQRSGHPTEIVVAVDGNRDTLTGPAKAAVDELADVVVYTGGRQGGAAARNLALRASSGDYAAYLDDDDEWMPDKLDRQLAALSGGPDSVVASGRVQHGRGAAASTASAIPTTVITAHTPVENYLFLHRTPARGRASLPTSTLLMRADLARRTEWDEGLTRHQDWDYLLRLQALGATIRQVPETIAVIWVGTAGSISATSDWSASLRWADSWRSRWNGQTYVDFVAGQSMRYALQAHSWIGVRTCMSRMRDDGSLPSAGPGVLAAGGALPRRLIERMLCR